MRKAAALRLCQIGGGGEEIDRGRDQQGRGKLGGSFFGPERQSKKTAETISCRSFAGGRVGRNEYDQNTRNILLDVGLRRRKKKKPAKGLQIFPMHIRGGKKEGGMGRYSASNSGRGGSPSIIIGDFCHGRKGARP